MALSYERRHAGLLGLHKRPTGEFSFVGLVRNIEVNTAVVGNQGAGLDPLHSFSLPANSLRSDGDYLHVWYGGDYATNANLKRVVTSFGGTIWEDTGLRDLVVSVGWAIAARIVRLSSTSVLLSHFFGANAMGVDSANVNIPFGSGGVFTVRNGIIAGLPNLNLNPITMLVSGEGTADNDVIQNLSIIELVQN
jgi:hypothetical protein